MTLPRKTLVSINDTPFYHCVSRCVRRAFLCGHDRYTSKNYEHRRSWLEYKLLSTAEIFAIKLCSYAVMSNHYHVVLHVRTDIANDWSDFEVCERWHRLFKGTLFSQAFISGDALSVVQRRVLNKDIKIWRRRLCDISWFMRVVNESIARQANREDKCSGRFWEGRFKSQALLDDKALLSCMAYVDLNPIRAKMAGAPENSEYTSIKKRLVNTSESSLEDFVGIKQEAIGIPFKFKDYLQLVDWTGRAIRDGKRGFIDSNLPSILDRLAMDQSSWIVLTTEFETCFQNWVGNEQIVRKVCQGIGYQRIPSAKASRLLLN